MVQIVRVPSGYKACSVNVLYETSRIFIVNIKYFKILFISNTYV